jgi:hypothetical protein
MPEISSGTTSRILKTLVYSRSVKSPWLWAIFFLVVVRIICLYLTLHNIPYVGAIRDTWFGEAGGDQMEYFNAAKSLLSWNFIPNSYPLGYSLLLLPFILIFKPASILDIARLVVILQGVIFYSLATIFVYLLARQFLRKLLSLSIASFFLIYPYLFYLFFHYFSPATELMRNFTITRFNQLMFFLPLSDPLSTILVLGSFLLILKIYNKDDKRSSIFLGFITSWAIITRLQNAILGPIYVVVFLVKRQYKNAVYFILSSIPLGLLQMYANYRINGSPFKTVYSNLSGAAGPEISFKYPLKIIEYSLHYSPLFLVLLLITAFLVIIGAVRIIRLNREKGWLLAVYFFSFLAFISFFSMTFLNPRYFLPIIPAIFIFIFAGFDGVYDLLVNIKNRD